MKKIGGLLILMLFVITQANAQIYFSDVAPIIYNKCGNCHHENQHASSLLTYADVNSKLYPISAYLSAGYMPPWSPDTTYTRFSHERTITENEKSAILNWIQGGALLGDTTKIPTPPIYSNYQLYGQPDLELKMPVFTSNANTNDSYVCFSLPSGLTQNRIIRAFEIVAGNPSIVHHVIVNVDSLGTTQTDLTGNCFNPPGDYSLGGFAPGAAPTVFPNSSQIKMGINLKAGSRIVLQIHYPAGSAGNLDSTKIRFYFYPVGTQNVRQVMVESFLQNWNLNIPANTIRKFTASYPNGSATLPYNLSMFGAFPHSHKLATNMTNFAYKGKDTIPLIRINKWDFNWQGYYFYKRLIKVPMGYKLFSTHTYDNTSANPYNPSSPPQNVSAGFNTKDEMLFDSYQFLNYQAGDENINIDSILSSDPLITGIVLNANNSHAFKAFTYPNPFEQSTNISFYNPTQSSLYFSVYNLIGEKVFEKTYADLAKGYQEIVWEGKNRNEQPLPKGAYLFELKSSAGKFNGKVILN